MCQDDVQQGMSNSSRLTEGEMEPKQIAEYADESVSYSFIPAHPVIRFADFHDLDYPPWSSLISAMGSSTSWCSIITSASSTRAHLEMTHPLSGIPKIHPEVNQFLNRVSITTRSHSPPVGLTTYHLTSVVEVARASHHSRVAAALAAVHHAA